VLLTCYCYELSCYYEGATISVWSYKLHGFHTIFVDSEDHWVVDKLNSVEYCVCQS